MGHGARPHNRPGCGRCKARSCMVTVHAKYHFQSTWGCSFRATATKAQHQRSHLLKQRVNQQSRAHGTQPGTVCKEMKSGQTDSEVFDRDLLLNSCKVIDSDA